MLVVRRRPRGRNNDRRHLRPQVDRAIRRRRRTRRRSRTMAKRRCLKSDEGSSPSRKHIAETAAGRELVDLLPNYRPMATSRVRRWTGSELGWKSIAASTSLPCPFFTKPSTRFRPTVRSLRTNLICWPSRLNGRLPKECTERWRDVRVVEGTRLESQYGEDHQATPKHSLRNRFNDLRIHDAP